MKMIVFTVLAGLLISGCASYYHFTPQLVTYYDKDCKVNARQMVLNVEQRQLIEQGDVCRDEMQCASMISGKIIGAPVSAIVAGSIVVAGDTLFWLEKQGRCLAK